MVKITCSIYQLLGVLDPARLSFGKPNLHIPYCSIVYLASTQCGIDPDLYAVRLCILHCQNRIYWTNDNLEGPFIHNDVVKCVGFYKVDIYVALALIDRDFNILLFEDFLYLHIFHANKKTNWVVICETSLVETFAYSLKNKCAWNFNGVGLWFMSLIRMSILSLI
jgi:hypothetical protein